MDKYRLNHSVLLIAAAVICLLLFLFFTNPEKVPIGLLVLPIILFFLIVYSLAQIIIHAFNLIKNIRKRRIVSVVTAVFCSVILILQTTGGISVADMILLGLIVVISAIYIEKF